MLSWIQKWRIFVLGKNKFRRAGTFSGMVEKPILICINSGSKLRSFSHLLFTFFEYFPSSSSKNVKNVFLIFFNKQPGVISVVL